MNNYSTSDPNVRGSSFEGSSSGPASKPAPPRRRPISRIRPKPKTPDEKQPQASTPSSGSSQGRSPQRSTSRKTPSRIQKPPPKPQITSPIIGLTACFHYKQLKKSDVYFPHHYLWDQYVNAILEAGGIPVIIPVGLENRFPNKIIELLHGLVLTGGGDIDPNMYDGTISHEISEVDPRKDLTEFDLFNLAFNKNVPILGICRGVQLINVALDGTLYQDIPSLVKMASNHKPDFPYDSTSHQVRIEPDTRLYKALGESRIWVNSIHHQAIKLHGKGLLVNAKSNDGIIEGIEHPTKKWVVGVQWHPELIYQTDKIQAKLFKAFVDACKS